MAEQKKPRLCVEAVMVLGCVAFFVLLMPFAVSGSNHFQALYPVPYGLGIVASFSATRKEGKANKAVGIIGLLIWVPLTISCIVRCLSH